MMQENWEFLMELHGCLPGCMYSLMILTHLHIVQIEIKNYKFREWEQ